MIRYRTKAALASFMLINQRSNLNIDSEMSRFNQWRPLITIVSNWYWWAYWLLWLIVSGWECNDLIYVVTGYSEPIFVNTIKHIESGAGRIQVSWFFLTDCIHHLQKYLLHQTILKLVSWFQSYEQLKGCKSNKKKRNHLLCLAISLKSVLFEFTLTLVIAHFDSS